MRYQLYKIRYLSEITGGWILSEGSLLNPTVNDVGRPTRTTLNTVETRPAVFLPLGKKRTTPNVVYALSF